MVMSNLCFTDWPYKGNPVVIAALATVIGITGTALWTFFVTFHRHREVAEFCFCIGTLGFVTLLLCGHFACRRQTYALLAPPVVHACLLLGLILAPPLVLVIIWLQPLLLIWGLWVAIRVAADYTGFMRTLVGIRRAVLLITFAAIFFLFEASSILAFPSILGLIVDVLESLGIKMGWS
jgi:hypothetical protein